MDEGSSSQEYARRRVRQGTTILLADLFVQFLLGIWVAFFNTNFPSAQSNLLRAAVDGSYPILTAHLVNAVLLLLLALVVFSYALESSDRRSIRITLAGLLAILGAISFGFAFLETGLANDGYSYGMAVAFLAAVYLYYALLALPRASYGPSSAAGKTE